MKTHVRSASFHHLAACGKPIYLVIHTREKPTCLTCLAAVAEAAVRRFREQSPEPQAAGDGEQNAETPPPSRKAR